MKVTCPFAPTFREASLSMWHSGNGYACATSIVLRGFAPRHCLVEPAGTRYKTACAAICVSSTGNTGCLTPLEPGPRRRPTKPESSTVRRRVANIRGALALPLLPYATSSVLRSSRQRPPNGTRNAYVTGALEKLQAIATGGWSCPARRRKAICPSALVSARSHWKPSSRLSRACRAGTVQIGRAHV